MTKPTLISGPEALTFAEQAAILTEVSGKQIDYIAVPQEAAESAMKTRVWMTGQQRNLLKSWLGLARGITRS